MTPSRMWIVAAAFTASAAASWTQEPIEESPPASLSAKARIAPADEPGDPLVISGQVFDAAGLHPVPD